ncbi:MAG: V-type ATP synthase subunit F [Lachnospiraceae bacterium]|nr:V-type ATP synthase subunit F [Lachnospiraceae bacterium]
MYKIAVMGDYDSIYGFSAIGLATFPVSDTAEAAKTLHQIADSGYGIIYITEELADRIRRDIDKYRDKMMPSIILIPGVKGDTGEGVRRVKASVEQAVGSDILFGEDK